MWKVNKLSGCSHLALFFYLSKGNPPSSLSGLLVHPVILEISPTFFCWKVEDFVHGRSWTGLYSQPVDPLCTYLCGSRAQEKQSGMGKAGMGSLSIASQEATRENSLDKSFDIAFQEILL